MEILRPTGPARSASVLRSHRKLGRTHHPKTDPAAPAVGVAPVAVGTSQVAHNVVQGPSAHHTPSTIAIVRFKPCPSIRRCTVVVLMQAVLDPFPDIARHIVETKGVGVETSDRCGAFAVCCPI